MSFEPIAFGCFDGEHMFSCHLSQIAADETAREHAGTIVKPLFDAVALAAKDAEIEKLKAALTELHRTTDLRNLRGLKHVPSMREHQKAMLNASAALKGDAA